MISFFIICLIIYGLYSFFKDLISPSPADTSENSINKSNTEYIYPVGEYESGFYMEEVNVFVKGPIYTYLLSKDNYFFGYTGGKLSIKNSSGTLEIELRRIGDNRVVPTNIELNGERLLPINKYGEFVSPSDETDFKEISVARTTNHILDEQDIRNFDHSLQTETYYFLLSLLVFNMSVKRSIIFDYTRQYLHIENEYIYILAQELEKIRTKAESLIEKYSGCYIKGSSNSKIEKFLSALELPTDIRDMNTIKKQYKLLAKKYHPDVNNQDDTKFKEITDAYNELFSILAT